MMLVTESLGKLIYVMKFYSKTYFFLFLKNIYISEFWEFLFWYILWKILGIEFVQRNFLYH